MNILRLYTVVFRWHLLYLASKQIPLCSQCPGHSFQDRWRRPGHPSRHSCPVCPPSGSWADEAWPSWGSWSLHLHTLEFKYYLGTTGAIWDILFLRDIFTRDPDGGNPSAISENLLVYNPAYVPIASPESDAPYSSNVPCDIWSMFWGLNSHKLCRDEHQTWAGGTWILLSLVEDPQKVAHRRRSYFSWATDF